MKLRDSLQSKRGVTMGPSPGNPHVVSPGYYSETAGPIVGWNSLLKVKMKLQFRSKFLKGQTTIFRMQNLL